MRGSQLSDPIPEADNRAKRVLTAASGTALIETHTLKSGEPANLRRKFRLNSKHGIEF